MQRIKICVRNACVCVPEQRDGLCIGSSVRDYTVQLDAARRIVASFSTIRNNHQLLLRGDHEIATVPVLYITPRNSSGYISALYAAATCANLLFVLWCLKKKTPPVVDP